MNKWIFAIIAVVVLVFLGITFGKNYSGTPASKNNETQSPEIQFRTQAIEMTAKGFVPDTIVVLPGTTVNFVNSDKAPHWPASGVHPTHQLCAGFDSLRPIAPGEFYEFTFTEVRTCPMHDHLNPSLKGTITVQNPQ